MKQTLVANRYAKSLFELASEKECIEVIAANMQLVGSVCEENRELRVLLNNPVIPSHKKNNVLEIIFKGQIHEITQRFLDIITRKGRAAIIQEIADEFGKLFLDYQDILPVQVQTAIPMDESTREHLLDLLHRKLEKNIQLEEKVDPSMIGGLIINVDDLRMDASLRTKLRLLKQEMIESVGV